MAEIVVLGLKLDFLAKPNFFSKRYAIASKQFATAMNIEITTRQ